MTTNSSTGSALTPVHLSDRGWSKEAILALTTIFIMILLSSMGVFFKYRTIFILRYASYFPLHFGSKWPVKRQDEEAAIPLQNDNPLVWGNMQDARRYQQEAYTQVLRMRMRRRGMSS
ncbi:hypothetical protein IQ07DRAFT_226176 [Pyrenochaeta sp. DS3sAY3a]|nr:hypothetical protein IQ07DRAFT_226176 [Pyrenochaeta sp. DS3sAY3a]